MLTFCFGRDGLHRLLASFNLLHEYLKETDRFNPVQFQVKLLLRDREEDIFNYINRCKDQSYKADSFNKKLPLSIYNAMIDLIVKVEKNLRDDWLGFNELVKNLLAFYGSQEYIKLVMDSQRIPQAWKISNSNILTSELDKRPQAPQVTNFDLSLELNCELRLAQVDFEAFFKDLLSHKLAAMPSALIKNVQAHFEWKKQQEGDIPPTTTNITAAELINALHQLWAYQLLVTLHQELRSLNVAAIMLLGLPLNEDKASFGLEANDFLDLFVTVNNRANLTTLPGLSASRDAQNKFHSEILAHIDRSLGGKAYCKRNGNGTSSLCLSSKALNAITLCLASLHNIEVSKSLKRFLSKTLCQDEALQTLQCIYAFFGTFLIQFELVCDTRRLLPQKHDSVEWVPNGVIATAFVPALLSACLKHFTDKNFFSQNESVEKRYERHIDPRFSVDFCFGPVKRTFEVTGRGSGCFIASCLYLREASSRVFQTGPGSSSNRKQAQELWIERWNIDIAQAVTMGTIMKYDAQDGISTDLNDSLGFTWYRGDCIGFAHLSADAELDGVHVVDAHDDADAHLNLNDATEENRERANRDSQLGSDNGDVDVSALDLDQGQESNSLEDPSSPSQGKTMESLRLAASRKRLLSPQHQHQEENENERKQSGRKSRKKSRKKSSGRGGRNDTGNLLNQVGFMYEMGLLNRNQLDVAVSKCGTDPANYDFVEHSQTYSDWMWSNLKDLGLSKSNRNGNGNVLLRGNGDQQSLSGTAFFSSTNKQSQSQLEDDEEEAALQRVPPAAAKGKGKAQRQRMAGKQPTRNDNGSDDNSPAFSEEDTLGWGHVSRDETGYDWDSFAVLGKDLETDLLDYNNE